MLISECTGKMDDTPLMDLSDTFELEIDVSNEVSFDNDLDPHFDTNPSSILIIQPEEVLLTFDVITKQGNTQTVSIASSQNISEDFQIEDIPQWLVVSQTVGTTPAQINISPNTTYSFRYGEVLEAQLTVRKIQDNSTTQFKITLSVGCTPGLFLETSPHPPRNDTLVGFTGGNCFYTKDDDYGGFKRACQLDDGSLGPWEDVPVDPSSFRTVWGYPAGVIYSQSKAWVIIGPHWGHLKLGYIDLTDHTLHGIGNEWEAWTISQTPIRDCEIASGNPDCNLPVLWGGGGIVSLNNQYYYYSIGGFAYCCVGGCPSILSGTYVWSINRFDDSTIEISAPRKLSPLPRSRECTTMLAGKIGDSTIIYSVGGSNDFNCRLDNQAEIYGSFVNDDGTLRGWFQAGSLPNNQGLTGVNGFIKNGCMYIIGGSINSAQKETRIYKTTLTPDGQITNWQEVGSLPNEPTTGGGSYTTPSGFIGDFFYVLGRSHEGQDHVKVFYACFPESYSCN